MNALGRHILGELFDCQPEILNDVEEVEKLMKEAALESGATILGSYFHPFTPQGVSGVIVIAESHLSIHTWPEYRYAAVDIFSCGKQVDPWKAFHYLRKRLMATHFSAMEVKRGQLEERSEKVESLKVSQNLETL